MALKASLVITGDAASATAAVGQLDAALDKNAAAARRAGAANDEYGRKVEQSGAKAVKASGAAQAGAVNLGRQVQDIAVQLQSGTNIGTIVAQQGGQVADAVAMMGGRFAGLAGFLAGPWGAAVIVGAGVLINQLIPAIFGTNDAMDEGEDSSFRFSSALDVARLSALDAADGMRQLEADIRKTIAAQGDFQKQNAAALAQSVAIRRARLEQNQAELEAITGGRAKPGSFARTLETALPSLFGPSAAQLRREGELRRDIAADSAALPGAKRTAELAQMAVSQREVAESLDAVAAANGRYQRALVELNESRQRNIDDPLAEGGINDTTYRSELRRITQERDARIKAAREAGRTRRERTPRKGTDPTEFGEDTAAKIARITDQFSDLPPAIARSNDAMRQLDDIASDLEKKKGPRYEELIGRLGTARQAIRDSLTKPFDEYVEKAKQSAAIDRLLLGGKRDQAAALQDALTLQARMGPLTEQQLETILKTVIAERERGELLQRQQEMIGNYLDATRSVRGEIEAILSGTGKLSNLPQIFRNLQGKELAEKLFGPMFRELDRWVQDESGMKDATSAYISSTKTTGEAALELAAVFRSAGGQIKAGPEGSVPTPASPRDQYGNEIDPVTGNPVLRAAKTVSRPNSLLDVTIDEYMRRVTTGIAGELTQALNGALGTQFFNNLTGALAGAMQGFLLGGGKFGAGLGLVRGLVDEIGPGLLGNAGKGISDVLDKGFKGMATGAQISGLAGAFGIKLNNTGAQIGGAIGGALPIPGGAILGSIAGGLLGGLFTKPKRGAVSIGNVNGEGAVTGTAGNDADRIAGAKSVGTGVNAALQQLAERLGGELGNFAVAIGQGKENFRVSASGNAANAAAKNPNKRDLVYDGKDEAAAISAALANAIADGAIGGLSNAVQKALKANAANIDRALAEALKVQEIEALLGGVTGTIEKAFASFERQAKERVRIATAYGFDVVKIEELNAKERLKLSKQLLEDQVGSLQRLIDQMTGGSLFEGSAVDRRAALLDQIGKARSETDAGVEGAADKLAGLLEQLNSVSREVFGTTGGFAADRGAILDQARDAIAKANQRIAEAQTKSDPALTKTNAALDENNDQNAEMIALLKDIRGGGATAPSAADFGYASTTRLERLASTQAPV